MPGGTDRFVVAEVYASNKNEKAPRVPICRLHKNFVRLLQPKIELDIPSRDLKIRILRRQAADLPSDYDECGTIASLGGIDSAEITLYEYFEMLAWRYEHNMFEYQVGYVRDTLGIVRAVSANFHPCGFYDIEADTISAEEPWPSRNGHFISPPIPGIDHPY